MTSGSPSNGFFLKQQQKFNKALYKRRVSDTAAIPATISKLLADRDRRRTSSPPVPDFPFRIRTLNSYTSRLTDKKVILGQ